MTIFCLFGPAAFLSWTAFVSVVSGVQTPCQTHVCVYLHGNTEARCDGGGNLSVLPLLPESITSVTALRFNFSPISRKSFGKLDLEKLKKLHLESCNISVVDKRTGAFSEMKKLSSLVLSKNNISTDSLKSVLSELETESLVELWLSGLGLKDKDLDVLNHPRLSNVQVLNLSENLLNEWRDETVAKMRSLRVLNATKCPITSWKEAGHPNLEAVFFVSTRLKELPSFCDKGKPRFPKLQVLDLNGNLIRTVSGKTFSCLSALKSLNVSSNPFDRLPNNTFAGLHNLSFLNLDTNNISFYETAAFNSTSIYEISILGPASIPWSHENFESLTLFEHCRNLVWFKFCFTSLSLNWAQKRELLLGLKSVRILLVCYSDLGFLPSATFQHFTRLEQLILPNNYIVSWSADVFHKVRPLRRLMLSSNLIQTIMEDSLPSVLRSELVNVDLSGNPFNCNASLRWFAAWLSELHGNASVTVRGYPEGYVCWEPPELRGKTLVDAFSHEPSNFRTVGFIALAAGVVLFIGAGLCLLRWRSKLGNCCCPPSRRRRDYKRLSY